MDIRHTPFASVSPYSVFQFAKAFKCRMLEHRKDICIDDQEDLAVDINSFAIIQHSLFTYKGKKGPFDKFETEKKVDDGIIKCAFPVDILASGDFSIILNLDEECLDYEKFLKIACVVLNKMKFIGGVLVSLDVGSLCHDEKELKEYLRTMPSLGMFYVLDHDVAANKVEKHQMSPAESIFWSTSVVYSRDNTKPKKPLNNPKPGFRFPSLIGYQLLEHPKYREGTRCQTRKHAYAEPIFSVINRVWTAKYLQSQNTLSELGMLWHRKCDAETMSIYVQSS